LLDPAESDRLVVVLVRPRNPLNIGAAARAMSNFGFRRLRVVNPFEVAFREARSAVGAADLLARAEEHESVAEAVSDCGLVVGTTAIGHREPEHPVRLLEDGAELIRNFLKAATVSLLFGPEKTGLTNEDLSHCHWLLHIPTSQDHASMNLGQAVAVCLYEIARAPTREHAAEDRNRASSREMERVTKILLEALAGSGYVEPESGDTTEMKVRRLVRRLNLDSADADVLTGMLRQIVWRKLKHQ
jgi:TrmH family RNA methyltransferase